MSASQDDIFSDQEDVDSDGTLSSGRYQMRPKMNEVFKTGKVTKIINRVLADKLQGKNYNAQEAKVWTKAIADEVSAAVYELKMTRYKHVVQVSLGQQLGSGCRYVARCRWDAESDSYTSGKFTNATLYCVCTVFGIYLY